MIHTHSSSSTLFTDDSTSQQLPPCPELKVIFLGESRQLTDITPVMESSFGGLAASASSRNRANFVLHPISEREGYTEDGRTGWRCKRCKSFVLVLMCRSWRTVTRVRKIPLFGEEKVELHINKIQLV